MKSKNPRLSKGFGLVSSETMRDPNLGLREKALYAFLSTYANTNNEVVLSINRIAAECDITPSTVKRILKDLESKQIIARFAKQGVSKITKTVLLK